MKRDIKSLSTHHFEVLVVGGGIIGATIAWKAARAGLNVALIEKNDFCHSTSSNSLKILHGGLRYLQYLDFKRMRKSIRARREIIRFAPHLVQPLPCIMPVYNRGLQRRDLMKVALLINDLIGYDRNRGVDTRNSLPRGRILSKQECLEKIPGIREDGLNGACLWYDALILNPERLTLEYLVDAYRVGARVANYLEAIDLIVKNEHVVGVKARDHETGTVMEIKARFVVNACGPNFENFVRLEKTSQNHGQKWCKAINLVIGKPLFGNYAVGLEGQSPYCDKDTVLKRGKRLFFFVPWRGRTLIGTSYKVHNGVNSDVSVSETEIHEMVSEINEIYPSAALTIKDISFYHAGILPMSGVIDQSGTNVLPEKHSRLVDHRREDGIGGIVSVKSVKFTTAPEVATSVMRLACRRLGVSKRYEDRCTLAETKDKPTAPKSSENKPNSNFEPDVASYLQRTYGRQWENVLAYVLAFQEEAKNESHRLSKSPHILPAEVKYYIEEEMALHLSDVILRRSDIGTAKYPNGGVIGLVAEVMAKELGWSGARRKLEIDELMDRYPPAVL